MRVSFLYNNECWKTRKIWTLFTKFLVFGAREAHRRKQQQENSNKKTATRQQQQEIAPLLINPPTNESPDDTLRNNDTSDINCQSKATLVQTSQWADYRRRALRNPDLKDMGIFQYSMYVGRIELPKKFRGSPAALKPPLYSFAQHYVLYRAHCQRMDTKRGGFTMPTQSKGPETLPFTKARFFAPGFAPAAQTEVPKCDKLQPFERLSDKDGRSKPWNT